MASRSPAKSTRAVWPGMSWHTTRAGNQEVALALVVHHLVEALAEDGRIAPDATRFSAWTRAVESPSQAPG